MMFRWSVFVLIIYIIISYFELTIICVVHKRRINLQASENRQQFVAFFSLSLSLSFRQIFSEISEINDKARFPFLEMTTRKNMKWLLPFLKSIKLLPFMAYTGNYSKHFFYYKNKEVENGKK